MPLLMCYMMEKMEAFLEKIKNSNDAFLSMMGIILLYLKKSLK